MAVVHRIYAQALLEAAKENGALERVREEFGNLAGVVADSAELRSLLANPQVDLRAKRDTLEQVLGDADPSLRNFVRLLAEKGRIDQLEEVHAQLERLIAAEERVLNLELTTAIELSDQDAGEIVKQIEEASGRRVEASRKTDPSLIGGLVLQAGSLRLDASVRGRLNQLRQELVTRS